VTTLAGTAGSVGSADGIGAAARFFVPSGVATDSAGNVYVADFGNNTIRKITPAEAVSTVVGMAGQAGFAPGALPGVLRHPIGVAVSGTSLYITFDNGVAVVQNRP
jgi:DNA-binding beta-propeller fold protein YncE